MLRQIAFLLMLTLAGSPAIAFAHARTIDPRGGSERKTPQYVVTTSAPEDAPAIRGEDTDAGALVITKAARVTGHNGHSSTETSCISLGARNHRPDRNGLPQGSRPPPPSYV